MQSTASASTIARRITSPRKGRWTGSIHIPGEETKNGRIGVEVVLAQDSVQLLRDYIEHFRPLGANAKSAWLFPHRDDADRARSPSGFSRAIADAIENHLGLRVNLHAFRAFAGAIILAANPHAIDDVRAILGHSGFETAMIYYCRNTQRGAAKRLSSEIASKRQSSRLSDTARGMSLAGKFSIRRPS